ncbi:phage antirepressor [Bacillus benzoevorans]|uniref:Anti-repressor protein n=1 Tax=Bacillus benzoevorans TaxID=1456 RepID=A0A7X0HTD6_9BACI|nr:phage antirepressor [Bacillus benzoevorans]MBB6446512.1 anti-repressor protein [Bacillus benzoevorans]
MNQLQVFNFKQNEVRTILKDGQPWFVVKDVCDVLEISNPSKAVSRLDDDERSNFKLGRQGEANIINEYGLYSLVLSSRKPEAKEFKRWITHEVIPSIRKHGAYMTPEKIEEVLLNPDTIIKLATDLKEERQKRVEAEQKVIEQKPKVLFADAVEASVDSILIGQLAKLITQNGVKIGQNRLFEWLRENGYLGKKGARYNEPTQQYMERGFFEVKERTVNNPDGTVRITRTTKITGKGQIYFINKFLRKKEPKTYELIVTSLRNED